MIWNCGKYLVIQSSNWLGSITRSPQVPTGLFKFTRTSPKKPMNSNTHDRRTSDQALQPEAPEAPAAVQPPPSHIQSLDGIRGFACLIVVFYHCHSLVGNYFVSLEKGGWWQHLVWQTLEIGYSGVDLFFVLSGFCLALPFLKKPYRKLDWKIYAQKRAKRILPPYWIVMLIFGFWVWAVNFFKIQPYYDLKTFPWTETPRSLMEGATLFSHIIVWSFWTLPIEWRWYFVLPLVVLIARRCTGLGAWLIMCAVTGLCVLGMKEPHFDYLLRRLVARDLVLYFSTFALGVWAAHIWCIRRSEWSRLEKFLVKFAPTLALVFFVSIFLIQPDIWKPLTRIISFGPFYFFLLLAALSNELANRFFSWKPFVSCGIFHIASTSPMRWSCAAFIRSRCLGSYRWQANF